jgi:hypothetical protein
MAVSTLQLSQSILLLFIFYFETKPSGQNRKMLVKFAFFVKCVVEFVSGIY